MAAYEIHPLDLRFQGMPQAIASFLVLGVGGPVLVETGPGSTLAQLQAELARFDLRASDIRDVLLTHIHLDHAGAAGWWASQGTRVHMHHLGAPHLIDPERLLTSARRIYGEQMDSLWGEFLAAPAQHVYALHDGDVVQAGGLSFRAYDTPGHARHHLVYALDDVAFVGDLAGIRVPGQWHLRLPTPPPEFDQEAWQTSLAAMQSQNFRRLYLTHFGPVDDVETHWGRVAALLPEYAGRVRAGLEQALERDTIAADFAHWESGRMLADGMDPSESPVYAGLGPAGMSVDGLIRYWQKRGVTPGQ